MVSIRVRIAVLPLALIGLLAVAVYILLPLGNFRTAALVLKAVLALSLLVILGGFIWAGFGGATLAYGLSAAGLLIALLAIAVYVLLPLGNFRTTKFAAVLTASTAALSLCWLLLHLFDVKLSGTAVAWICTAYGIFAGAICGLMNGTIITKLKLPPFIVTLGTMSAFRGISYVMNDGQPYDMPTYRYLEEGLIPLCKTLEVPAS